MRHFPVFLDLAGRIALVVGDGEAAARKAAVLAAAGAEIRRRPVFDEADLEGCAIAFGADAPEASLAALSATAMARGIPVNVVDRPALSSFISPAIVDRAPVTVAVSTGGAAPVLARLIRAAVERAVPPAIGRLAAFLADRQAELRRRLPDLRRRRRVIERALTGAVGALALAGRDAEARAALDDMIASGAEEPGYGFVSLVGAGPGAADLVTLRGQRLLGEADVVVHDRLASPEVLALARRDATLIHAGKARARHCMRQEEINDLLVRLAREGKRVVRLKGGDPLIFGRGGEEAEALQAAGVAFEIVPGVTAALACAADAGIALTHREAARTLTFATGHTKDGVLALDFAALARAETLAIYMGAASLPALQAGLVAAGYDPEMPAALIVNGGTGAYRVLAGPFRQLADSPPETGGAPGLLLLGNVVGRRALGPAATATDAKPSAHPARV